MLGTFECYCSVIAITSLTALCLCTEPMEASKGDFLSGNFVYISRTVSLLRYNKGYFHEKVKTVTVIANCKIGRIFKYC